MNTTINYTNNNQLWSMEAIAENNGFKKTADCYWTQIFENENGDKIVTVRESEISCDPVEAMQNAVNTADEATDNEEVNTMINAEMTAYVADEVRALCIKNNWYTLGTNSEYTALFDMIRDGAAPEAVAADIFNNSEWIRTQHIDRVTSQVVAIYDNARAIFADDNAAEMIDVDSLTEDLSLGEYGGYLNDYRDSDAYICDAISEIADNNTSIYYSDILKFISANPEALADVIDEGLYSVGDGVKYDLYKHGQAAEYMMIERDIYDNLADALFLTAVDFIRYDLKLSRIPAELADLVREWADNADNNDRMNDITDNIREYLQEADDDV